MPFNLSLLFTELLQDLKAPKFSIVIFYIKLFFSNDVYKSQEDNESVTYILWEAYYLYSFFFPSLYNVETFYIHLRTVILPLPDPTSRFCFYFVMQTNTQFCISIRVSFNVFATDIRKILRNCIYILKIYKRKNLFRTSSSFY